MTIFVQQGNEKKELTFTAGQTLLEILREAGYEVSAPCGGNGTCGKCTVYIAGEAHLACQTEAADGMMVELPHTAELEVALGSDAVFACDSGLSGYGVAVDIGTTTVACHLMNLENGKTVAVAGEGNAQRSYGADVISRIQASVEGRLGEMAEVIRKQLGEMMKTLCREAKVSPAEVRFMTVAANTTMCHILAGLKPDTIGVAPFTPLSLFGDDYDAKAWGLPFDGRVYLAPSVSGYVGGDITADLLAVDMDKASKPVLLIDVGTNGEMALG
ncbi:MAG: 2Fe-2S iron-sulfur cluster binding domain-containing protein, partial [Oscillospiraceae bacterium]|nr:2Fe-2S iron-sulfur cluster binding domain-containing protein [Oscillospiraceae bacterium]